jgi:hypothetical protein
VIEDMSDFFETMRAFAARLYSAPAVRPTVGRVPDEQCVPSEGVGREILPDQSYFTVTVNELFIAIGRQLWATYDPMVLVTVEYMYKGTNLAIPIVIGPGTIKRPAEQQVSNVVINDIPVAGPHPYRGGKITITVLLYKIKHTDYARGFLRFAESISKSAGVPANIDTLGKVGAALLEGVEELLKMKDNEPIAGHMFAIDDSSRRGFRTGYAVLMSDSEAQLSKMRVNEGRLEVQNGSGYLPYREGDYVLYSVSERSRRGEVESLSFYSLYEQSRQAAIANDDESWKRAKASLLSLYGQMVSSPDLISSEVEHLTDEFTARVVAARDRAKALGALSAAEKGGEALKRKAMIRQMNSRMGVLDL